MKRSFDAYGPAGGAPKFARSGPVVALKMLVSPKEAGTLIGKGGMTQKQISDITGCKLHLSGMNELYPGTQMQEVCVRAEHPDAVSNGVLQILSKLSEETGKVMGGEWEVEDGGARVHFIVPTSAARNIIGKGGEYIKGLRQASGMKVHIEEVVLGNGDAAEQVISLAGPLLNMQTALPMILEKVTELSAQPWFGTWAYSCLAAGGDVQAKGKGDAGKAKGMDAGYKGGAMGGYNGYKGGGCAYGYATDAYQKGKGKRDSFDGGFSGKGGRDYPTHGTGAAATQENIDMLSTAVSAMPPSLASAGERSQVLQFNCAASYVSALIGKAGMGTKQIAITTDTKIMIREIDGNQAEKTVVIKGNAVNVASAYLHVASRLSNIAQTLESREPGADDANAILAGLS